jgi:hypothetical protein
MRILETGGRPVANYSRVRAWTGGSAPAAYRDTPMKERLLACALFRDSMRFVFAYWTDYRGLNRTVLESARIHWNRARHDAHSTLRDELGTLTPVTRVRVGDRVIFHRGAGAFDYTVEAVETDSIGHVRHRANDDTRTMSYAPDDSVYVRNH